jgi:hypothetical protein
MFPRTELRPRLFHKPYLQSVQNYNMPKSDLQTSVGFRTDGLAGPYICTKRQGVLKRVDMVLTVQAILALHIHSVSHSQTSCQFDRAIRQAV